MFALVSECAGLPFVVEAQDVGPTTSAEAATGDAAGNPMPSQPTRLARNARSTDISGYALARNQIQLGLFYTAYGITDWLSVGTDPIPWVLGPVLKGLCVNLSIKLSVPLGRHFAVGLEANPIWFKLNYKSSDNRAFLVPMTLGVSAEPDRAQTYSLALRYVSASGVNDTDLSAQEVAGAVITRAVQVLAEAHYELTRNVAVYGRAYLQAWEQNLRVQGTVTLSDTTSAQLDGEASASGGYRPWAALAGIHLSFGVVNLRLAAGYGSYFVPHIGIALPRYRGPIPDLDFYVRF